jgi:hypothetical protein
MPIIYRLEIDFQKNKQSIISTAKSVIGMIDVDGQNEKKTNPTRPTEAFFLTGRATG